MYRIPCAEVWGGVRKEDLDACAAVLTIRLHSSSRDGEVNGTTIVFAGNTDEAGDQP
jgi:hypothetical protein